MLKFFIFELKFDFNLYLNRALFPIVAELREFVEAQQMFCRHCDVAVQQAMVKKKFAELGLTPKDDVTPIKFV